MDAVLHASERMDWQTPDEVLTLVRAVGAITLDPCTSDDNPTAARSFLCCRGLDALWYEQASGGLVYVNPPYGRSLKPWIDKCCVEGEAGSEIVLLVPARPDTAWYDAAHSSANAKCEWRGRMRFKGAPHCAPFPSALFYWGPSPWLFCHVFAPHGRVEVLR